MKSVLTLATAALICAASSNAGEPLTKVYGPEARNDEKSDLVYVTFRVLEFEGNPFDTDSPEFSLPQGTPQFDPNSIFDPLTYFEINTPRFLPDPLNKGANEFFSQIENSPDKEAPVSNGGRGVSGIMSDPQFQVLIRFASQLQGVTILEPPSVMISKDQFFTAALDDGIFLAGVASPKGGDAIALSLFSPSNIGGPLSGRPNTGLVIADSSTIAYTVEAPEGGKTRVYFVKLQLINPAGS